MYGLTVCGPDWPWANHMIPTDGTGYVHYRAGANDSGVCPSWPYSPQADSIDTAANDLAAILGDYSEDGRKWDLTLAADPYCWYHCIDDPDKMDDWIATYDAYCHDHGIKYAVAFDWFMTGSGYNLPEGLRGQATYQTPVTDKSWYTPADETFISSWDAAYGPALEYFESHVSEEFYGYEMEFVWTNAQRWLYNKTPHWVIVKDWTGWQDPTCLQATSDVDGSDVTYTMAEKLAIVDECVVETFDYAFVGRMLEWIPQIKAAGKKVGWNVDQPCRVLSYDLTNVPDPSNTWWVWQGIGQPNNRCWWERTGYLQTANFFKEQFGAFDTITFNPVGSLYPWDDHPMPQWYMKLSEDSYMHIPSQQKIIQVPLGAYPASPSQTLPIAATNVPLDITIEIYDIYGKRANMPDANLTFTVPNTSIEKTLANLGIFWAHPIWHYRDYNAPAHLLRLTPTDLGQLATGTPYTLSIDYNNKYGERSTVEVTSTFSVGTIELSKPWILPETDITGVMNDATTLYGKPGGS
jgi:hypothetical protein